MASYPSGRERPGSNVSRNVELTLKICAYSQLGAGTVEIVAGLAWSQASLGRRSIDGRLVAPSGSEMLP